MKLEYDKEIIVDQYDIDKDDGGQALTFNVGLAKIPTPGFYGESPDYRLLYLKFESSDYPQDRDVNPIHPEFDALIQSGKKLRIKFSIEEIQ